MNIITEKECSVCGLVKPITNFHNRSVEKDGYNKKCKKCVTEYINRSKKTNWKKKPRFGLTRLSREHWCNMYELLKTIGYDIQRDIHEQFIKKYNITEYKERPNKNTLTYKGCDCLDGSNETYTLPD